MIFDRKWRIEKLEQKIAGKKAKLTATRDLFSAAKSLPGSFAIDMTRLPQEIAEMETEAKQLMASNVQGQGRCAALSRSVPCTAGLGLVAAERRA